MLSILSKALGITARPKDKIGDKGEYAFTVIQLSFKLDRHASIKYFSKIILESNCLSFHFISDALPENTVETCNHTDKTLSQIYLG